MVAKSAPTRREFAVAAVALALLALVMTASRIAHGGFHYDDWGILSIVQFPAPHTSGALDALWPYYSKRPGEVAWYALVDSTLGYHASWQLALSALALTVEIVLIYVLLRMAGLRARHAGPISALTMLFPYSDSQWLWAIMSMSTVAAALGAGAVILAARALERPGGRRGWALHGLSAVMLAASILSYEVFAAFGCLSGLLYARRVGMRAARVRWAVDVAVVLGTLGFAKLALPDDRATPVRLTQSANGLIHHAGLIVRQGARVFAHAALPVGDAGGWAGGGWAIDYKLVLAALIVPVAVAVALRAGARRDVAGTDRWLNLAAAGILTAAAAWAIYLPAIDYYSPGALGTGNRVNGLAGVGVVMFLYADAAIAAKLLAAATPLGAAVSRRAPAPLLSIAVFSALLGGAYLHRTRADARVYNRAVAEQHRVLRTVRSLIGPLAPQRITVYAFDYPTTTATWVAVFRYPWDLSGALKHDYGFRGIAGVPVSRGTRFSCGAAGFYPTNNGYHRGNGALYGQAFFVDVGRRQAVRVTDRASCQRVTTSLAGGERI